MTDGNYLDDMRADHHEAVEDHRRCPNCREVWGRAHGECGNCGYSEGAIDDIFSSPPDSANEDDFEPDTVTGPGPCPNCGGDLSREEVDVDVGIIYGPWGCYCGWSSDAAYDQLTGPKDMNEERWLDQWGMAHHVDRCPRPTNRPTKEQEEQ